MFFTMTLDTLPNNCIIIIEQCLIDYTMLGDEMNTRMKKVLLIFGSAMGFGVLLVIGGMVWLSSNLDTLESVELSHSSFSTLEDGVYIGQCDEGRWETSVEVTVVDGALTSIRLVEDVTFPEQGVFEQIKREVLERETLDVDAVSGATLTSNAYLTAIDKALKEAGDE